MGRAVKQLGRNDFINRVNRIEKRGFLNQPARTSRASERPFLSAFLGFGWFYAILAITTKKDVIEASLAAGNLSEDTQFYLMAGLTALVVISFVLIGFLILRLLMRLPMRRNNGGILTGALAAGVLTLTPPEYFAAGYDMLDDNTKKVINTASLTVQDIDWQNVVMVASNGG